MTSKSDFIYSLPLRHVGDFEFDAEVAQVFPDMIRRSVPGYASILAMIGEIASLYVGPDTTVYDLGCSLGGSTFAVLDRIPKSCKIIAVDNAAAMLDRFSELIPVGSRTTIDVRQQDIRETKIQNASLAILNFTLQFIPIEDRTSLLQTIYDGGVANGALVLSEKIRLPDDRSDALMMELHHAFKRANGYSELEIAQKRTALENRLLPETLASHVQRLNDVGFSKVLPWFQSFNFVSILAIK